MAYQTKNYTEQGGERTVIGGELDIATGGKLTAAGTQASAIANAKVNYTTGDLDAEAEIIAALNATNGTINSILTALRAVGIIASS